MTMIEKVARALDAHVRVNILRGFPADVSHDDITKWCGTLARAAIQAMRPEIASYRETIEAEAAEAKYYSVEEGIFDEARETALSAILTMIDAALAEQDDAAGRA